MDESRKRTFVVCSTNAPFSGHIDGKSPEGLLIFALNLCFLPCIVAHIPEVVIGTSQEG
jgi:hypothetical protein